MLKRRIRSRAVTGITIVSATVLTALGVTALPATASTASQDVGQVPCTGVTFTVYYGANSAACYEGTGELPVRLHQVHKITTWENTGYFTVISHGILVASNFTPQKIISFPASFPTLTLIDITST
jgi:hypothetical protein